MFLIAGLGNPPKEYDKTRHNAGFMLIDELSDKYGIGVTSKEHKALVGKGVIEGYKVILAKPQTYMNLSGESIRELADYYKLDPESEIIVISDDIDLPPGYIRVRPKGSAGGHNGLKNIIQHLGTQNFMRIRLGVGEKPSKMDLKDFVLARFDKESQEAFDEGLENAKKALVMCLQGDIEGAMNQYNKKVSKEK